MRVLGLVNSEPSRLVVGFHPGKTWNEVISNDLQQKKVSKDLNKDRNALKSFIRNGPTHKSMENKLLK